MESEHGSSLCARMPVNPQTITQGQMDHDTDGNHSSNDEPEDEQHYYVDVLNQVPPEPIELIDHTTDDFSTSNTWAKDVHIDEHNVIQGNNRAGAYVVWVINIDTFGVAGGSIQICKRFSEFVTFRQELTRDFPNHANEVPPLPPKSIVLRFKPKFLEQRRRGLQYFLLCVLLNPTFSSSTVVKSFIRPLT